MIIIPISELKRFIANSKNIKDSKILPILSYLKIECKGTSTTITKTNLNSFVVSEIECDFKEDQVLLIEEKVLAECATFSRGQSLSISISGKNIVLDDGHSTSKCQRIEDHFPAVEIAADENKTTLNTDVICAMSIATKHALLSTERGLRDWKSFVNIIKVGKKNCVAAANGSISYFKYFKQKLPVISLEPETVGIISKFPELEYFSSDRYDYFRCLDVTYGFIKSEVKSPELDTVLEKFKSDDSFEMKKRDMVDFCESAIFLNGSSLAPEVCISEKKDELYLTFEDIAGNRGKTQKIVQAKKTYNVSDILFQPRNMLTALSGIDADTIKISKIFGNMILSTDEDKDYIGSVMELARLNQPA